MVELRGRAIPNSPEPQRGPSAGSIPRVLAHVLLCWLALLLVRVTEVTCGEPWWQVRQEMNRLHRGVFESPAGRFVQLTRPTNQQKRYLKALQVPEPPRFEKIEATQRQIEMAPS